MSATLDMLETSTGAATLAARVGGMVNILAELSDVADGFCAMLRGKLPDDCGPEWRALVRLASTIAAEVGALHEGLDLIFMALPDPAPNGQPVLRVV